MLCIKPKVARTIYSLYLRGVSMEGISDRLRVDKIAKISPAEVSDYIDALNSIYL